MKRRQVGLTRDVGWNIGVSRTVPVDVQTAWDFLTSPGWCLGGVPQGPSARPGEAHPATARPRHRRDRAGGRGAGAGGELDPVPHRTPGERRGARVDAFALGRRA